MTLAIDGKPEALVLSAGLGYQRAMDRPPIQIRRLALADATSYRGIRLEALAAEPRAFGSTYEAESARPLAWFSERIGNSHVFGAFQDSVLVGTAGLLIEEGQKEAHKGLLVGMYVRASFRGTGIGRRLVQAVIEFAPGHVELIQLAVGADNEPARRLYASLGFLEYGLEKRALKQDGHYFDEILMALDIR